MSPLPIEYEGSETEVPASKWNCFGGGGEEDDEDFGNYKYIKKPPGHKISHRRLSK